MARKEKHPGPRAELLLSRFMDFCYEEPKARPAHIALYAHIATLLVRLGQPRWLELDTDAAMKRAKITNRSTYYRVLSDLAEWGWIEDGGRGRGKPCVVGLSDGEESLAFGRAAQAQEPIDEAVPAEETAPPEPPCGAPEPARETTDADLERFDRVFDAWSRNVAEPQTFVDKRWLESAQKETGIRNVPMALKLYKEHIIKMSKAKEWMDMPLAEKRSYFIFAAPHFANDECRRERQVVATVERRNGASFVRQFGCELRLPVGCPPQPDVDYYWDESWKNWRHA